MPKLQRYRLDEHYGGRMLESDDGDYVLFDEVESAYEAELSKLAAQVEVMRSALDTCITIPGEPCEQLFNIPMVKEALSITKAAALNARRL